jgi:hypothetical protein
MAAAADDDGLMCNARTGSHSDLEKRISELSENLEAAREDRDISEFLLGEARSLSKDRKG